MAISEVGAELQDGSPLRVVHDELVRIEAHWTEQVQNQQSRILAVLTVNGFLLAFLSTAGFLSAPRTGRSFHFFCGSLLALAVAVLFGVCALIPSIPIGGSQPKSTPAVRRHPDIGYWLDSWAIWNAYLAQHGCTGPGWYVKTCDALAQNANGNDAHHRKMVRRRRCLYAEVGFIAAAMILLILAIVALLLD